MTELQMRQNAVQVLESWLGYSGANGKKKKIIDLYNSQKPLPVGYKVAYSDAWCATTVSAVGVKLGLTNYILPECSCGRMIELYKKAGRWEENDAYVPQLGDLVMYDWGDNGIGDNKGAPDHVGMVTKVSNNKITVIEGNKNDAVAYREISVNGRYIRGFCLPDYKTAAKKYNASTVTYISVNAQQLQNGDSGNPVKVLQASLNALGFNCGTVDGEFGANTEKAVKALQKSGNMSADGIVGKNTWQFILN